MKKVGWKYCRFGKKAYLCTRKNEMGSPIRPAPCESSRA